MRLAVTRNDLPGPILLADLEQVSRRNDPVDAAGQVRYISFPTAAQIETALADATTGVGATIRGSALSFNVTITGASNDVLRLRTASGGTFVNYTIAAAAYTNIADLLAAVNTAIAGSGITAFNIGNALVLESDTPGVNSYVENDTIANGSTANTILGFANGSVRNMPSGATYLAAGISGGSVDVSQATLEAVGATTNSNALEPFYDAADPRATVVADVIAPIYAETDVALDSFLVGMLSEYRSANFNPDSRNPSSVVAAAIDVVEDDGSTAFETANTLPTISSATLDSPTTGDVTIAGTGLGNENGGGTLGNGVIVKFTGVGAVRLEQKAIIQAGGSVLPTAIIVPASLIPSVATTTTSVQVQVRQRLSAVEALA